MSCSPRGAAEKGVGADDEREGPGEVPTAKPPRMLFGTGRARQGPRGPCALQYAFSPSQGSLLPVQTPIGPHSPSQNPRRALIHLSNSTVPRGSEHFGKWQRKGPAPMCCFVFYPASGTLHLPFQSFFLLRGHRLPYLKSVCLLGLGNSHDTGENFGRCPFNGWQPRQPGTIHSRHFLPCDLNRLPEETQ